MDPNIAIELLQPNRWMNKKKRGRKDRFAFSELNHRLPKTDNDFHIPPNQVRNQSYPHRAQRSSHDSYKRRDDWTDIKQIK